MRQGVGILIAILLAKSAYDVEEIGAYEQLLYIGFVMSFFWVTGPDPGAVEYVCRTGPGGSQSTLRNELPRLCAGFGCFIVVVAHL